MSEFYKVGKIRSTDIFFFNYLWWSASNIVLWVPAHYYELLFRKRFQCRYVAHYHLLMINPKSTAHSICCGCQQTALLRALAWQPRSSGLRSSRGVRRPVRGSEHVAALAVSTRCCAASKGAVWICRDSLSQRLSHSPSHTSPQSHVQGLSCSNSPPAREQPHSLQVLQYHLLYTLTITV